jgi:uncharacterized membrane protein YqgA involved in biofilm formation
VTPVRPADSLNAVIGTFVNAGAIVAGGVVGALSPRELPARQQVFLKTLLGLLALLLGLHMAWNSIHGSLGRILGHAALAMVALGVGNVIGKSIGIQRRLNRFGRYAKERFRKVRARGRPNANEGFVTGTILFCAGPLSILGALQDGLLNDPRTLVLKAAMDGLAAIAFVKVFGAGVIFAALPVLAYQGTLTLLARYVHPMVNHAAVFDGLNAVGGLLVAMTSLLILDVRKIALADYLPALVLGPLLRMLLP